jgi:methyl-accepting chemotaxis protein
MITIVTKATGEQAVSARQITGETDVMRQQSEQLARAVSEQARATKETREATANISQQVRLIAQANIHNALSAESIRESLAEARHVTDRNASTATDTLNATTTLLGSALELSNIMDKMNTDRLGSNGSAGQSAKKRSRQSRKNVKDVAPPQETPGPSVSRTPLELDEN